ncbi:PH domain-containing protein [Paenibacillus sp. FSL R5-0475]|uniref:PH domain-containing protein n=2 Tax=Paenibacillus sp. FSL R5-0475 TaxID=2921643 RepID=UPI004046F6F4
MGVQTDFSTPTLTTDTNGRVSIEYPMYNYSFAMKDVQELTLVDSLPRGRRTNGVATDTVAIGNFKFDGFGKSKVYLVKNSPPYIVIKLPDVYVLYNNKDATETERLYAELKGW